MFAIQNIWRPGLPHTMCMGEAPNRGANSIWIYRSTIDIGGSIGVILTGKCYAAFSAFSSSSSSPPSSHQPLPPPAHSPPPPLAPSVHPTRAPPTAAPPSTPTAGLCPAIGDASDSSEKPTCARSIALTQAIHALFPPAWARQRPLRAVPSSMSIVPVSMAARITGACSLARRRRRRRGALSPCPPRSTRAARQMPRAPTPPRRSVSSTSTIIAARCQPTTAACSSSAYRRTRTRREQATPGILRHLVFRGKIRPIAAAQVVVAATATAARAPPPPLPKIPIGARLTPVRNIARAKTSCATLTRVRLTAVQRSTRIAMAILAKTATLDAFSLLSESLARPALCASTMMRLARPARPVPSMSFRENAPSAKRALMQTGRSLAQHVRLGKSPRLTAARNAHRARPGRSHPLPAARSAPIALLERRLTTRD